MPNDNAITRLLYAILSQNSLRDINWDKVANEPILNNEITNGHAARMRYSRFKKQMDASTGNLQPPTPRKPRKNRVEKTKSAKKDKRPLGGPKTERDDEKEIKSEGKGKGKEREHKRGVKSEYGIREGTGESLLSSSASMSGSLNRDTPELEGGLSMMPSPAVSLAQHDLSSALHHSHSSGLGMSSFQNFSHASSSMSFADAVQVKRERKPSAKTLNGGLFTQAQAQSPQQISSEQLQFNLQMHNGTSTVSNSTHPSTPRMCIEEHDQAYDHRNSHSQSQSHTYSPNQNPARDHSPHSHTCHPHHGPNTHDSFGLASLGGDDDQELDELLHSFGMPGSEYGHGHGHGHDMYSPLMAGGEFAIGMGVGMGVDAYDDGFWGAGMGEGSGCLEGESSRMGGGGAVVKKEERWEEAYRR
ncbi:hypothetical protein ONS95_010615 [Cadophora gregata]|uniref:uncharacterized protein n=1 Tax=Cadophora gregata TaxID=51156 RepID=UPI0026DD3D98|nr:uncharacterized protein ONS95_010615 [Cadophora gregata]KAK0122374.1 hypothetical protein ONS95_010615 [Cadophora gregata]